MERILDSWYSPNLEQEMEIVVYGSSGTGLLMFPSAAADYLEYERFHLIDSIKPLIEDERFRAFSINSINSESWLNHDMAPRDKAVRHQQYNLYIEEEVVPYLRNALSEDALLLTTGVSLGAFHATNVLFRRPDLFDGVVGMSGIYDLKKYANGYWDQDVYFNSPMDYLPNLKDEEILRQLRSKEHIHFLSGSGPYEDPNATEAISQLLDNIKVPHETEIWSDEWSHDWPTWRAMLPSYLQRKVVAINES